jgi:hypothetical protein
MSWSFSGHSSSLVAESEIGGLSMWWKKNPEHALTIEEHFPVELKRIDTDRQWLTKI